MHECKCWKWVIPVCARRCFLVESECKATHEVSAMLVMGNFRRIAPEEGIAVQRKRRIRIGRHVTCISSKADMPGDFVFHSATNTVRKIHSRRVASAVEFMRKAHAPCEVWPPLVLFSENRKERSKLILVYARI